MTKVVQVEILLLFTQECITQFMVYPPYSRKELQKHNVNHNNYDWRNNVYKGKRRRKNKKYVADYSDFSGSDNCGTCSCNECYTKSCCKTMCNRCESLIFVPYPVPYLVPEMFTDTTAVNTDAEKNKDITTEKTAAMLTVNTTITAEITTTFATTEAISTTTTDVTPLPPTLSTHPIFIKTPNKNFKYKKCPHFPVGACLLKKTTQRDFIVARDMFSSHYLLGTLAPNQNKKSMDIKNERRTDLSNSNAKTYWIPLEDVIPIPNEIAEEILSNIRNI